MLRHLGTEELDALDLETIEDSLQRRAILYDRAGDQHHDTISAFIKSVRGSSPDGALYWLGRMVEAGEDPLFIARRLVILAAEDIGLAEPMALPLAVAAQQAVHFIGMPEGAIPSGGGYGVPGDGTKEQLGLCRPEQGHGGCAPKPQRTGAAGPEKPRDRTFEANGLW